MAPLPMLACSGGLANGSLGGTGNLVSQALAAGFASVAVQFSQTTAAQVSQIASSGLTVVGWDQTLLPSSGLVNSFINAGMREVSANIESLGEYNAWQGFFQAGGAGSCTKSVMTDLGNNVFNGTGRWPALQTLGCHIAYLELFAEFGRTDVSTFAATATQNQIPTNEQFMMFGTYRGEAPSAYTGTSGVARSFAMWEAEGLIVSTSSYTSAFAGWAGLNGGPVLSGVPAPPPNPPPSGGSFAFSGGQISLNNIAF